MKKLCAICLTLCLALTALAAAPGGRRAPEAGPEQPVVQVIDLSGYGDEQLVDLLRQVQAEIVTRNIEKTAQLSAGTYVFGQDIPVGKYVLRKSPGDQHGMIELAAADDPEDEYPSKLYEFLSGTDAFETFITAENGDRLTVELPCELTVSVGVLFQ